MLTDVFGFVKNQEKVLFCLGYKLILTTNKDDAVLDKAAGIADATIEIDHFHRYILHYTPSIQQQSILSNQVLSKTPTELRYVEQSVFMEETNNQILWNFELWSQKSMNVSIWIIIGCQQRDTQNSQNLNNDTFCRLPVTSAQCIIGTGKYPDAGILLKYDDDDYSQGYHQIKETFRASTKDNFHKPNIYDHDFRSSSLRADGVGYKFYLFVLRYMKNFTSSQPMKQELHFDSSS